MRPWSIVVAILAGLAIFLLIVYGGDGRDFSGREREGIDERAAQELSALPVALGPEQAIAIVQEREGLPSETAAVLDEVRGLVATAAGQPPDQAKPTLEQAVDRLDVALDQIEDAADDTSNDLTKIRLLQLHRSLEAVKDVLELRLGRQ